MGKKDRFKVKKSWLMEGSWAIKDLITGKEYTLSSSEKGAKRMMLPKVIKAYKTKTLWFSPKEILSTLALEIGITREQMRDSSSEVRKHLEKDMEKMIKRYKKLKKVV